MCHSLGSSPYKDWDVVHISRLLASCLSHNCLEGFSGTWGDLTKMRQLFGAISTCSCALKLIPAQAYVGLMIAEALVSDGTIHACFYVNRWSVNNIDLQSKE